MGPAVSIIVPVYNVEKYLGRCTDSLLSQSCDDIEIILVDDGSTDSSGGMCDRFASRDDRIRVLHKKNGGLSDARNAGLKMASGRFITYVDSDDYVSERYVEKLLAPFEKENVDISVCGHCAFSEDNSGKEVFRSERSGDDSSRIYTADKALEMMLRQSEFDTEAWAKMFRASLMDGFCFPVGLVNEDLDAVYKLFLKADKVSVSGEKLYYYLQRNDSIMGKKRSVKRYRDSFEIAGRLTDEIYRQRPDLKKAVNSRALSVYFQSYAGAVHCDDRELARKSWDMVKKLRLGVLADSAGRPKARAAAALSLLGRKAFMAAYDAIIRK